MIFPVQRSKKYFLFFIEYSKFYEKKEVKMRLFIIGGQPPTAVKHRRRAMPALTV
jgi:hypothetical protein